MTLAPGENEGAPGTPAPTVAVIGAGLAGLACAGRLAEAGLRSVVFEKSRGPSGRAATRRVPATPDAMPDAPSLAFDHGAQYFTARDPAFVQAVEGWAREGLVAEWTGVVGTLASGVLGPARDADRPVRRWVGVPGMNAVGRALARGLDVRPGVRVAAVRAAGPQWALVDADGSALGTFDRVVVAVPAPQAVPLLDAVPALGARAAAARLTPCWSAMVALAEPLGLDVAGTFVNPAPGAGAAPDAAPALSWIARDSTKPGRALPPGVAETWVLHATATWSAAHLEREPAEVAPMLLDALVRESGRAAAPRVVHLAAHRWRFALPDPPLDEPCLWDDARGIGACGDWCGGPRVEGAWRSGRALAERMLADA